MVIIKMAVCGEVTPSFDKLYQRFEESNNHHQPVSITETVELTDTLLHFS
jgi:hypothetical protein